MNILETEWWTMALPPEWWAESEEEAVLVGDRDGVGCIEISTLHRDGGEFTAAEVRSIADSESDAGTAWTPCDAGDYRGVTASLVEEGTAIIEWYVASGSQLLYITYSCDVEHRGMDDAAVKDILATLMAAA